MVSFGTKLRPQQKNHDKAVPSARTGKRRSLAGYVAEQRESPGRGKPGLNGNIRASH
jgi:hypothetical protein